MKSRRLLRCHALDFAGLQVEAHAMDAIEIGPGHANEAGIIGIVDRMDFAVLINPGVTGGQAVFLHRLELGVIAIAAVVLALPFGHFGVMGGLAVDRPRFAVIVRRRNAGLVVDMSEDLKAEFGILIKDGQAARRSLAAMLADEVRILQEPLELRAYLLAAFRSGTAGQVGTAIRYDLSQLKAHPPR